MHNEKQNNIKEMVPLINNAPLFYCLGPNDFVALDNQLLTIPSSTALGVNVCQTVTIVGDNIVESNEMFQVVVTPADSDDQVSDPPRFTITITSEPGDGMLTLHESSLVLSFLKNSSALQMR